MLIVQGMGSPELKLQNLTVVLTDDINISEIESSGFTIQTFVLKFPFPIAAFTFLLFINFDLV